MAGKRPLSQRGVQKMREREAAAGLEPGDEAAQWLAAHDPPPPPKTPKSASKNKVLHQWRKRASSNGG
jgi:hypothetical protein